MESKIVTSATKPEHSLRNANSNAFSTKLSLPKFIAVAKLLTDEQKRLVKSIGFHHLLGIQCDSVPRGICLWLAKHFDVKSRSIQLADGSKIAVTPKSIHAVLGIPIGGTAVANKCDDSLKKLIAAETKCKGNTPTINELKLLLTPDLVGDKFKRIFTLFAIGSFLCPTSYECISSDYYSAIEFPELISSHDWCTAVLDKLTNSIESYQRTATRTSTTTLGGCILALVIIYFELLDIPNHTIHEVVPRLKFWSTDMIKAFETLDAKDVEQCIFGRLPLKDSKQTILLTSAKTSRAPTGSTKVPRKCIDGSCSFKDDFASLSQDTANQIVGAIQPILSQHFDRMHAAWHCLPGMPSQASLLDEQKVMLDRCKSACQSELIAVHTNDHGKSACEISKSVLEHVASINAEQIGPSKTSAQLSHDNSAKENTMVNIEESVANQVQGNIEEGKLSGTNVQPSVEAHGEATSSFMLVPCFSEDSSNIGGSDDASTHPLHQPKMSESSTLEQLTSELKPCIRKDGEVMDSVFPRKNGDSFTAIVTSNHNGESSTAVEHHQPAHVRTPEPSDHCLDGKSLEIAAATTDCNGDLSTAAEHQQPTHVRTPGHCSDNKFSEIVAATIDSEHHQPTNLRTPEKVARLEEFDFFCHGLNSDFEVIPQSPAANSVNPDTLLSTSSTRKRPRSLNESALQLYSTSRLDKGSGSLQADKIAHHERMDIRTPMQSISIEEMEDAELIDHISQITPCKALKHHINFTSILVEQEIFEDIVHRIPFCGPSPRVVEIKKNWVDHKTFGLSMRVYGSVSSYVIDLMRKAVMTEEYEKNKAGLLTSDYWYRHVVQIQKAKLLQKTDANAQDLAKFFIEPNQGYRLDLMSMVFIPVVYDQFWYLVVANVRIGRFEVLVPTQSLDLFERDADTIILNFKRMFSYACPHSTKVHIWQMDKVFRSVTSTKNHCDSGIFVMKLIQSHDGESQHLFKPEEAKPLRECLTYYLLTHPYNDKFDSLLDIKKILSIHGISRNSYNW